MNEPNAAMAVMTGHSFCAQPSRFHASASPATSSTTIWLITSVSEMAPDGIGRYGSLIASRSRSNQSLQVCVKPQRIGPESTIVPSALIKSSPTTPQLSVVGASPKRFQIAW